MRFHELAIPIRGRDRSSSLYPMDLNSERTFDHLGRCSIF
jgi:hypothetical protein